jgi:hypothetical protein
MDGPTFLCSIGWDWIPGIRDRNTGIWRRVFLSASGPVTIQDPAVTSALAIPGPGSAELAISTTLANSTGKDQRGVLQGEIAGDDAGAPVTFQRNVSIPANGAQAVTFGPVDTPQLHLARPLLWWPNGYGPQHLYRLKLAFIGDNGESDRDAVNFGIRKITYSVPESKNLTLSVNGVPVFCRGGDWGMDEALKRIPCRRLEAQIRMHKMANLNMIRNWVGQSTSEELYDLCDRYGIMLWDEFFQPNPSDGPNPADIPTYMANARDKILRFRNHPSIAVWCGRNEGRPPPAINTALGKLMAELDPTRHYQPSSTDGGGVRSGGPYCWRPPAAFYNANEPFKTEIGSVSIPTLESIQGMMPRKDWEVINDDWCEHDLARGAQHGDGYPDTLRARYGDLANLADFARKGQLANYEAFRAMYEGRNVKLFHPFTGVITWMSHPAQPSFVWQLYHHDLEANASLFAVMKACEPVHIQMNESDGSVSVINNLPAALTGAAARLRVFNLDGTLAADRTLPVTAPASLATNLGAIAWPAALSAVHFVKLELTGLDGTLISDNFYWHCSATRQSQQNFRDLEGLPKVVLEVSATMDRTPGTAILPNGIPGTAILPNGIPGTAILPNGIPGTAILPNGIPPNTANLENRPGPMEINGPDSRCVLNVTIHNPGSHIALMTHLQLRRAHSGARVLPAFYSDNYLSLIPGETKSVRIEAAQADLQGEPPLIAVDGWNVTVTNTPGASVPTGAAPADSADPPDPVAAGAPPSSTVAIALNTNAQVDRWPRTGLPAAR